MRQVAPGPAVCPSATIRGYPHRRRASLKVAILAYGINYRTAAIELREKVAFPEDILGNALMAVTGSVPGLAEAAILSTCNRTEIYCAIDPAGEADLAQWLADHRAVPADEIHGAAYSHWDQDAARHLIRVAAGLDSQVLGEPQIMGQVKSACELARNLGTLGTELDLLFRVSLNAAKRVRTDTDIGRNPISVAYAAVAMAKRIFTDLNRKAALLLGAGDTIQRVAEYLSEQGIGAMAIANRTIAHAERLAARHRATPIQLTDVAAALHRYDIVIASTGSSLPVVGKGAVEAAMRSRRHKPVFMVDIAVPRDIEPEVADLPDVFLYSIDDLTEIIQENLNQRLSAADSAQALVDEGRLPVRRGTARPPGAAPAQAVAGKRPGCSARRTGKGAPRTGRRQRCGRGGSRAGPGTDQQADSPADRGHPAGQRRRPGGPARHPQVALQA